MDSTNKPRGYGPDRSPLRSPIRPRDNSSLNRASEEELYNRRR